MLAALVDAFPKLQDASEKKAKEPGEEPRGNEVCAWLNEVAFSSHSLVLAGEVD
jgi:hypothetical protein